MFIANTKIEKTSILKRNQCMDTHSRKIFTYIDFEKETPPYLNLCIKTWQKNLPKGYEIIFLNEKNLKNYIPETALAQVLDKSRKDCFYCYLEYLAASVLYYNGGIFLDADTIITDKFIPSEILLSCCDAVVYGNSRNDICSGFLMAKKESTFLEELMRRLLFFMHLPEIGGYKRNFVLNNVLRDTSCDDVVVLDCEETGFRMERAMYGVFDSYLYNKYYFSNISSIEDFIKTTKGITALSNSLTPQEYKEMDEEEFLSKDIFLAKIFNVLL